MTKTKSSKRALLMSALALLLCVSMLVGSTFAWFTDSVTTNNNIIKSGNLDAELYWSTDAAAWNKVDETTNVFSNELWEPGHTEVVYLKVVNEGTLAFDYNLGVNIVSETTGTNVENKTFKLSDYIWFGVEETATAFADRAAARAAVTDAKIISKGFTKAATLENQNDTDYLAMVVYMPETVGNEANYKKDTAAPEIKLGINLVATQYTKEKDTYGNDYDADALPCDVLATPETIDEILATVEEGTIIGLANGKYGNITLTCNNLTLISKSAVVDYVNANAMDNCKLIGITFNAAGAQMAYGAKNALDLYTNIDGAKQKANGADNLQILNCTFTGTPADAGKYIPVVFYERQRASGGLKGAVIDGCTFETDAVYYIYMYYPGHQLKGEFKITNNAFGTADTTVDTAVYVGSTQGHVSVIGNTFTNGGVVVTPHNNASCTYALKVSVLENHFINTADADATAIALRNFYALPKCSTLVRDNIANYGLSDIKAPYVDASSYECYDLEGAAGMIAYVSDGDSLKAALAGNDKLIIVKKDVAMNDDESNGYGGTGLNIKNGETLDGNGKTLQVNGATSTWDSAINITGGTIKNLTIAKGFRGVFVTKTNGSRVYLENVIIDGPTYTISCDSGSGKGLTATNSTFNGWTSYAATLGDAEFINCRFGKGAGYAFARPYAPTAFVGCEFSTGYKIDARAAVSFENCTLDGVAITAENVGTLVTSNTQNATVK